MMRLSCPYYSPVLGGWYPRWEFLIILKPYTQCSEKNPARGIEMDVARVICSSFDMPPPLALGGAEPGFEVGEVVSDRIEGGPVVDT
jgi:hypothetical protein